METENKIIFYRNYGSRFCRISAQPTADRFSKMPDATTWSLNVIGDHIPAVDNLMIAEDQVYIEAEKILADWLAIAKPKVLCQFGE